MSFPVAEIRRDFPGLGSAVYLNSAGMGVPPRAALDAVRAQLGLFERGPGGKPWGEHYARIEAPVDAARREAARLLGANVDEIGLVADTSAGLHAAVDAIPWQSGDNVVLADLEYPQVGLAARNAARSHGVEVRLVPSREGRLHIDDYAAAVDRRTCAILVSSVVWVTGQRLDVAALSRLAGEHDAFLVVDAIQELGVLPVDVAGLGIDFLAAGTYKWMNAPFGFGVLYVRRSAHERGLHVRRLGLLGLVPPGDSWDGFYERSDLTPLPDLPPATTARRFEAQGTPSWIGAAGLASALAHRNAVDGRASAEHVLALGDELCEGLAARGARIVTPREMEARSGIVVFSLDGRPEADLALRDFLDARGIYVAARWCSGVGGVRAAIHYFNDAADVARLLAAIDDFRRTA